MAWDRDYSSTANGTQPGSVSSFFGGNDGIVYNGVTPMNVALGGAWAADFDFWQMAARDTSKTVTADKIIQSAEVIFFETGATISFFSGMASDLSVYQTISISQDGTLSVTRSGGDGGYTGDTDVGGTFNLDTIYRLHIVYDRSDGSLEVYRDVDDDAGTPDASGTVANIRNHADGYCGWQIGAVANLWGGGLAKTYHDSYANGFPEDGGGPVDTTDMKVGSALNAMAVGSTDINKAYHGSTLIWEITP